MPELISGVLLMPPVEAFLESLEICTRRKILISLKKTAQNYWGNWFHLLNDTDELYELVCEHEGKYYRLFGFFVNTTMDRILVVVWYGNVKGLKKAALSEVERAEEKKHRLLKESVLNDNAFLIEKMSKSLSQIEDQMIGLSETPERKQYEFELMVDILACRLKKYRLDNVMTHDELSLLLGIKKNQLLKLEKGDTTITFSTLMKVMKSLPDSSINETQDVIFKET